MIFYAILFVFEVEVVLNRSSRISCFLILSWRYGRCHIPEYHQYWDCGEWEEQYSCPESSSQLSSGIPWNDRQEGKQEGVAETFAACCVCWHWSILNGGVLEVNSQWGRGHSRGRLLYRSYSNAAVLRWRNWCRCSRSFDELEVLRRFGLSFGHLRVTDAGVKCIGRSQQSVKNEVQEHWSRIVASEKKHVPADLPPSFLVEQGELQMIERIFLRCDCTRCVMA